MIELPNPKNKDRYSVPKTLRFGQKNHENTTRLHSRPDHNRIECAGRTAKSIRTLEAELRQCHRARDPSDHFEVCPGIEDDEGPDARSREPRNRESGRRRANAARSSGITLSDQLKRHVWNYPIDGKPTKVVFNENGTAQFSGHRNYVASWKLTDPKTVSITLPDKKYSISHSTIWRR